MVDGWCEGCPYHSYPYKAQVPIKIGDDYPYIEFRSDDDVWDILEKLIEEVNMLKSKGRDVSLYSAIYNQIPFFSCKNRFLTPKAQKDIQKYIYCKDFGCSPVEGGYGQQTGRWVSTSIIIKNAIKTKEADAYKKAENDAKKVRQKAK